MRFSTSVFFHQKYPPWTLIHILSFFRICFQIRGVIIIKVWLPAASCSRESNLSAALCSGESNLAATFSAGSQISPLYDAAGSQVNDYCRNLPAAWCSGGSQILLLHFAGGESNLTAAWCSGESNLAAERNEMWHFVSDSIPGPKGMSAIAGMLLITSVTVTSMISLRYVLDDWDILFTHIGS